MSRGSFDNRDTDNIQMGAAMSHYQVQIKLMPAHPGFAQPKKFIWLNIPTTCGLKKKNLPLPESEGERSRERGGWLDSGDFSLRSKSGGDYLHFVEREWSCWIQLGS